MRVLQINTVCGIGSTGRIATDIDTLLKKQGHESFVAYGRDIPKSCDTAIKIGSDFGNYSHVAKTRLLDQHGFGSVYATKKFINRIEELNPDVIHLHNIHGYYLNVNLLFKYLKKVNKPVVWTLHDCWPFTGHCSYFDYVNCSKWQTGCYSCPQKKSYPTSVILDNSKDNYSKKKEIFTGVENLTIVTPSKWLAELVRQSFLSEYPVKVINNGIDLESFKPTQSHFRDNNNLQSKFIILGVAGVWEKRKGYDHFLELSKMLRPDEVIIMVGLTDKQRKRLPSNIIGISRTNSIQELAEIYSTSDVFINPTLEDNFPTTNIEALACGTPIITYKTGGSVECLDNDCGFVVNKGSIKELLMKIDIVKNKGKSSYKNYCVERAAKLYDKKDRFNEYIQLYKLSGNNIF
ncbi:glycosyltransferase [Peribacillus frigoritolerans]|uniref:glycosyltransferase n=1 Tax=Peribacillus frigoritolerans TaxID=450367 RepID=UPI003B8C3D91